VPNTPTTHAPIVAVVGRGGDDEDRQVLLAAGVAGAAGARRRSRSRRGGCSGCRQSEPYTNAGQSREPLLEEGSEGRGQGARESDDPAAGPSCCCCRGGGSGGCRHWGAGSQAVEVGLRDLASRRRRCALGGCWGVWLLLGASCLACGMWGLWWWQDGRVLGVSKARLSWW
jgi:hypothetical protein